MHVSMGELSIRLATEDDDDFLFQLHRQAFFTYVKQAWSWDEAQLEAAFRQELDGSVRQVICLNGQDIGSVVVEDHGDALFLDYLAILPAYQRKGLGTRLVQTVLREAAGRGKPVKLNVLKVNPVKRLYERLGFSVSGEDEYRYFMIALPGDRTSSGRQE